ncbi:NAD-dependent succinate-semialdehyde dehydrogenase [Phycicoccus sp. BSK3Z-2]|uniref:NAD-dependent succinate-semialdehyde dehydrogenase n=1 Tax=Phycicoccus avicenniae TaxID=2828860 RepID=A0A941I034_9MICO|nr:NAD-dependent succinate-semialdehyde dehydrogenase [Phycicoccus avicenniae]MBR7742774.1 NAD-dependent succinate-semialdehyde dehydrogenase [Phycicoccus avicenniae]
MTSYRVVDPSTNEQLAEYPEASDDDLERTLAAAHAASARWREVPVEERAAVLARAAGLVRERRPDLAATITREMGKRSKEAAGELSLVADILDYYAQDGPAMLADEEFAPRHGGRAVLRHEPIGVLLGVMPWNFPHYQAVRLAASNLLAGNTVVVKPAPQCPESARDAETLWRDAGLPDGAYTALLATDDQVATAVADPRVAGVSVTGSERAGSAVAAEAGRHLKKVVLELGGSDPFIVLDDVDLDRTVKHAVMARTQNSGQACNAGKRFLVVDAVHDAFVERFAAALASLEPGDPSDPATTLAPLSSERAAQGLTAQVQDALDKGATALVGGSERPDRPGAYVTPTLLAGVTPGMRAHDEELFGPVAVVHRVADADEAVARANDSRFGLGGAVFGADPEQVEDVVRRLETGMVWVNAMQGSMADLPFGGVKRSGTGRELGRLGIREFVNTKLVYTPGG